MLKKYFIIVFLFLLSLTFFAGCEFNGEESRSISTEKTQDNSNKYFIYKVEYYKENINSGEYALIDTIVLSGLSGQVVNAEIREYENYTYNQGLSTSSGIVASDENLTLSLYYTLNSFILLNENPNLGAITNSGIYKYGNETITSVASEYLGCEFCGWYENDVLISYEKIYTYSPNKNIHAKFSIKPEMSNFIFNSNEITCEITGILLKFEEKILVPNYVTSISDGAFQGCWCTKEISLPFLGASKNANDGYNQVFGYIFGYTIEDPYPSKNKPNGVFQYYDSTKSERNCYWYKIPTSIESIKVNGGSVFDRAFYNCTFLENVEISTETTYIGNNAFYNCEKLRAINIPNSVKFIGDWAFYNCDSLNSVAIPESVSSIGGMAFGDCSRLCEIILDTGISYISSTAFAGCSFISSVYFLGTTTQWGGIIVDENWKFKVVCIDGEVLY